MYQQNKLKKRKKIDHKLSSIMPSDESGEGILNYNFGVIYIDWAGKCQW